MSIYKIKAVNEKIVTMIWLILIIIIVVSAVMFWGIELKFKPPYRVYRAMVALDRGREYEIIIDDRTYLTIKDKHTDLMIFFEGHYGYEYMKIDEDDYCFLYNGQEVVFETSKILGKYILWVRR